MGEAPARINLELCSGMGRDFYREVGSHPMDEPIPYVRADIVDELRDALEIAADILNACLFENVYMRGQYINRKEAVDNARAALAKSEAKP